MEKKYIYIFIVYVPPAIWTSRFRNHACDGGESFGIPLQTQHCSRKCLINLFVIIISVCIYLFINVSIFQAAATLFTHMSSNTLCLELAPSVHVYAFFSSHGSNTDHHTQTQLIPLPLPFLRTN